MPNNLIGAGQSKAATDRGNMNQIEEEDSDLKDSPFAFLALKLGRTSRAAVQILHPEISQRIYHKR